MTLFSYVWLPQIFERRTLAVGRKRTGDGSLIDGCALWSTWGRPLADIAVIFNLVARRNSSMTPGEVVIGVSGRQFRSGNADNEDLISGRFQRC